MLTEMRSLGTSLGNIDGRLSAIDNILDDISTSVTSIQEALSNLWLNAESPQPKIACCLTTTELYLWTKNWHYLEPK